MRRTGFAPPSPIPPSLSGAELDGLIASLAIDHALPPSAILPPCAMLPGARDEVLIRLRRLTSEVLPAYAEARANASRPSLLQAA